MSLGRALSGPWERNENEKKMSKALEKVAKEIGAKHITSGEFEPGTNRDVH